MPQIIINIYCQKNRRLKCNCDKHTKKRYAKKRRRCRKKTAYKTLYEVNRIKINCPMHPSISVRPIVKRYFFVAPYDMNLTDENVIYSNQFVDDHGEPITEFSDFGQQGYFNLYVNGVLQEGKMYHVNSNALTLAATGQHISKGTPIIVESVGFTTELVYK